MINYTFQNIIIVEINNTLYYIFDFSPWIVDYKIL